MVNWVISKIISTPTSLSHRFHIYLTFNGDIDRALKIVPILGGADILAEAVILQRLHPHPNVIDFYGQFHGLTEEGLTEGSNIINVLVYCSNGILRRKTITPIPEKEVKLMARNILHGLEYIHSNHIVQCDVYMRNILLADVDPRWRPNGSSYVLYGFELAIESGSIGYGLQSKHNRTDPFYMAPELITGKHIADYKVDCKVDIWSFGCIVVQLLTATPPWQCFKGLKSLFGVNWHDLIGRSSAPPYVLSDVLAIASPEAVSFVVSILPYGQLQRSS